MIVQKVAIVKNMLVYTICYTFNVGTNKTMVVEDTTMQIVVVAYILVVDKGFNNRSHFYVNGAIHLSNFDRHHHTCLQLCSWHPLSQDDKRGRREEEEELDKKIKLKTTQSYLEL
jgi:hypothetical protein